MENNHPNIIFGYAKLGDPLRRNGNFGGITWSIVKYREVCTSIQTDNHASTPLLSFLQAGCLSCRPTNSVKALKALQ